MSKPEYSSAISALLKDFREILEERDRLSVRLVEILASVRAMSSLSGEEGPKEQYVRDIEERIWQPRPNLTYAIEVLLQGTDAPLTPIQIKEELIRRGYDLRKYSFAMAAIHASLKGLVRNGIVERTTLRDGSKLYQTAGRKWP